MRVWHTITHVVTVPAPKYMETPAVHILPAVKKTNIEYSLSNQDCRKKWRTEGLKVYNKSPRGILWDFFLFLFSSLNRPFGSGIITPSGILLNSQMLDFSWQNKTMNHSIPRPVMNNVTIFFELCLHNFFFLFSFLHNGEAVCCLINNLVAFYRQFFVSFYYTSHWNRVSRRLFVYQLSL